jgi:hypothetical protein
MGNLKPGASYSYRKINGVTYAREEGSLDEEAIGWDHDPRTSDGRPLYDHIKESKLWGDIRRAAETNTALQEAIERVKIIYYMSKKNDAK